MKSSSARRLLEKTSEETKQSVRDWADQTVKNSKMKTLKDYVEAYVNDETVETVEMGGLSKDYEEAIQTLAFSLMARLISYEPYFDSQKRVTIIEKVCKEALESLDKNGYSGAQVGAAKNLAAVMWYKGPQVAMDEMRKIDSSRIIKIKNGKLVNYTIKDLEP